MKKLFICCCLLIAAFASAAQHSLISLSGTSVKGLNAAQRMRYDKLENLKLHVPGGLHLVTTDVPPNVEEGNSITLSLPFLPCGSITFAASMVDFKDADNFSWSGSTIRHQDSACSSGDVIIQKNGGLFIGNFTIDDNSYELYDLTGGLQLLIQSSLDPMGKDLCAITGGGVHPAIPLDETQGPCANVKSKVLILYTDATLQYTTDITGVANLSVAQNNQIWANSGINSSVSIVGIVKVDWNHNYNIKTETEKLAENSMVQSLRNDFNAELVVMLGPPYENGLGYAARIGGPYENAYFTVDVRKATNGWRVFSHELNHIFGARHNKEKDPFPNTAHGKIFNSGFLGLFNKRYTLMCYLPEDKAVIQHLSNPNIDFAGAATGDPDRNNAAMVNLYQPYVAEFKDDPALGLYTNIAMANPAPCETDGTATALPECGTPPYTYQWYTTNWPIGAAPWMALGTGQSTPTYIPLSSYGSYSRAYKVVVTDALGNTATYTKYAQSYCTEQQPVEPISPYRAWKGGDSDPYREEGTTTRSLVKQQVRVFPNPNKGNFSIQLSGFAEEYVEVTITDPVGRLIGRLHNGKANSNQVIAVNMPLPKGLYFLKVRGQNSITTSKLILN